MKPNEWQSDAPAFAPGHGVRVWIAHAAASNPSDIAVGEGFFDREYVVWRFENRNRVNDTGRCVIGWTPIEKPEYEAGE